MLAEVSRLAERPSVETLIAEVRDRKRLTGTQIDRDELLEDLDADHR